MNMKHTMRGWHKFVSIFLYICICFHFHETLLLQTHLHLHLCTLCMPSGGVKGQNKLLECRAVKRKFVSI